MAEPLVWTPERVISIAAEAFGVSEQALFNRGRFQPLLSYRQVSYALVKRFCGYSNLGTARFFGRDHSSVMHSIKRVDETPNLRDLYEAVSERLVAEGVA